MMQRYQIFSCIQMFFIITLITSAHLLNNSNYVDFLQCNGNDLWKSQYISGKLFGTFHVLLIIMGTVQAERAFYSVPHHMGYFDDDMIKLSQSLAIR